MNKNTGFIVLVISLLVLFVAESIGSSSVRWAAEAGLFLGVFWVGVQAIKNNVPFPDNIDQQTTCAKEKKFLTSAFDEMEKIITHEVLVIEQEIARIDRIIKEAAQVLGESLQNVKTISAQQIVLTNELLCKAINGSDIEHAEMISILGEQLEGAINNAVRALQFEDLSSQALASLDQNIHLLNKIAEQLRLVSFQNEVQIEKQLHNLLKSCRIMRQQQSIGVKRPVTQVGVAAGEVEVF